MRIICLVSLLCAVALGANVNDETVPSETIVTKNLERSQYNLHLLAKHFEETHDIVLPESQAVNIKDSNNQRVISGAIEDVLEGFRQVIINGNEDIPPLDPFVADHLGPYEYRLTTGVLARGNIWNLRMTGLRWFIADRIDINPFRLTMGMTLTVPWLTTTGSYDARARVGLLTHTAGGNFRIFAHRIEVGFDMRMGTNIFGGGHLVLRELDIHIDIHDTQISISGMTGSTILNNLISTTIQNISQDFIQNELQNVSRILSEELFDVINDVLKQYTVSDIFG